MIPSQPRLQFPSIGGTQNRLVEDSVEIGNLFLQYAVKVQKYSTKMSLRESSGEHDSIHSVPTNALGPLLTHLML